MTSALRARLFAVGVGVAVAVAVAACGGAAHRPPAAPATAAAAADSDDRQWLAVRSRYGRMRAVAGVGATDRRTDEWRADFEGGPAIADGAERVLIASGRVIKRWTAAGGVTDWATGFVSLGNLARDGAGRLLVADRGANRVYAIADGGADLDRAPAAVAIAGDGSAGRARRSRRGRRAVLDPGQEAQRAALGHPRRRRQPPDRRRRPRLRPRRRATMTARHRACTIPG